MVHETRDRILDVALDTLGQNPDAGMGEIAAAAGVVRRTIYGHFPTREDLVRTLAQRAIDEIAAVLDEVNVAKGVPEDVWADFVFRFWPLARRYRVLLALRRGEYGAQLHALLAPVDAGLAELVRRGQESGSFGRHLPADVLSQVAFSSVFAIADSEPSHADVDASGAATASLLMLGVPEARATALAAERA